MKFIGKCCECGTKKPIHKGMGEQVYCKPCSHLAPEPVEHRKGPIEDSRVRIRFKLGEEENESKKPETRGI